MLDKQIVLNQIVAALSAELESYARSAGAAHAEATDEQNKAENKYDTRGLEASYLARGQSRQASEVREAIEQYSALVPRAFASSEKIDLGALVELQRADERTIYFLGPRAGGTEVQCGPETVLVITPASPLGKQLLGCRQGDRVQLAIEQRAITYQVAAIS